jgi:hypothetical protein
LYFPLEAPSYLYRFCSSRSRKSVTSTLAREREINFTTLLAKKILEIFKDSWHRSCISGGNGCCRTVRQLLKFISIASFSKNILAISRHSSKPGRIFQSTFNQKTIIEFFINLVSINIPSRKTLKSNEMFHRMLI